MVTAKRELDSIACDSYPAINRTAPSYLCLARPVRATRTGCSEEFAGSDSLGRRIGDLVITVAAHMPLQGLRGAGGILQAEAIAVASSFVKAKDPGASRGYCLPVSDINGNLNTTRKHATRSATTAGTADTRTLHLPYNLSSSRIALAAATQLPRPKSKHIS